MALPAKPPTSEIGTQQAFGLFMSTPGRIMPWSQFIDDREYVPELMWPQSIPMYDRMRSDTQIEGLFAGVTLPIRRYRWMIDPNGADDTLVTGIADDLNLDIKDRQPRGRRRRKGRFDFHQHLSDSLLGLIYGHYFFEQSGEIGSDGLWHLRKLAPREPRTIHQINVAADGGLVSVKQNLATTMMGDYPEIPVDRLVAYVWGKEGANWTGRSMLRSCYRNWLLKDRAMRVDVINHERAGGVPYVISAEGATPTEIQDNARLAQQFKVSEHGGGSLPHGSDLKLARAGGSDVIATIRYHDEQMARRFLLMLMQLGQTQVGARNLGETFFDFFKLGQGAIADWFMNTFNEHVIEDWVDWNYGEQVDQVPQLIYEVGTQNDELAVADFKTLVDAGAIVLDADLEEFFRDRFNLPRKAAGAPDPAPKNSPQAVPVSPPGTAGAPSPTPAGTAVAASAQVEPGAVGLDSVPGSLLAESPTDPCELQLFEQEAN